MKKGTILSLSVLLIVVFSAFLIGVFGVHCQLWSRVALSGSKKIGTRLLIRILGELNLYEPSSPLIKRLSSLR